MKLTTTVPVTYNDSPATSKTAIMHATIEGRNRIRKGNETIIEYKYEDADGVLHSNGREYISDTEMDTLYASVKADLPDIDVVGHAVHEETKYYLGLKVKMLERFTALLPAEVVIDPEV